MVGKAAPSDDGLVALLTLDRFTHSGNSSWGLFLFCSQGVGALAKVTCVGVFGLSGVFDWFNAVVIGTAFVSTFIIFFVGSCLSVTIRK